MEEYIGAIKLFAGDYDPANYMSCDGSTLQTKDHPALAAVLGGYDETEFQLPDLPAPAGTRYIICIDGLFPPRK